jgi:hypothetical protein
MACDDYGLLLSKWIDDELTAEENAAVLAHLDICEACQYELGALQMNDQLVSRALSDDQFGMDLARSVMEAATNDPGEFVELEEASVLRLFFSRPSGWVAAGMSIAAAVLFMLTLSIVAERDGLQQSIDDMRADLNTEQEQLNDLKLEVVKANQLAAEAQARLEIVQRENRDLAAALESEPNLVGEFRDRQEDPETYEEGVPARAKAKPHEDGVLIEFNAGTNRDIETWQIERKGRTGGFELVARMPVTEMAYFDRTVDFLEEYSYRVVGLSSQYEELHDAIKLTVTTNAETQLTAFYEVGTTGVRLSWDVEGSDLPFTFNLLRKTSSNGDYSALNRAPMAATSFIDSDIEPMRIYWYQVEAVDQSGTRLLSPPVEVRIDGFSVRYLGTAGVDKQAPNKAIFEVSRTKGGKLYTEKFTVLLSDDIGSRKYMPFPGKASGEVVDFSTGYSLWMIHPQGDTGGSEVVLKCQGGPNFFPPSTDYLVLVS